MAKTFQRCSRIPLAISQVSQLVYTVTQQVNFLFIYRRYITSVNQGPVNQGSAVEYLPLDKIGMMMIRYFHIFTSFQVYKYNRRLCPDRIYGLWGDAQNIMKHRYLVI